jgi:3-dehydroquinate synthetase
MLAGAATIIGGALVAKEANTRVGSAVGQAVAVGGIAALKQGYDVGKQAKIHEDALTELASSFNAEVEPIVVEVEGEVVKLNGSLDAQYKNWRQLLRQIYSEEVGLPVAQETANEMGEAGAN